MQTKYIFAYSEIVENRDINYRKYFCLSVIVVIQEFLFNVNDWVKNLWNVRDKVEGHHFCIIYVSKIVSILLLQS